MEKVGLSRRDTRHDDFKMEAVYATGTLDGAAYYALHRNKTNKNDAPIIIEFESEPENVAVDGNDFLFKLLERSDAKRSGKIVRDIFGNKGLEYATKAWDNSGDVEKCAVGDIMLCDPDVVQAHYANTQVIEGGYGIVFRNAFSIALPISPTQIAAVYQLDDARDFPLATVLLKNLI
jgi:hypothetical protein